MKELLTTLKVKSIVFDFDGVLVLGSESLKRYAWMELGKKDMRVAEALREGRASLKGGGSRFDILKKAAELLNLTGEEAHDFINDTGNKFDAFVRSGVQSLGMAETTKQMLNSLKDDGYSLYINSSTPEASLQETVRSIGVLPLFKGTYGNPFSKIENLERVRSEEHCLPEEILFIGDQDADYEAAKRIGCTFIGITNDWNKWEDKPFPIIFFLEELRSFLP